MQLARSDLREPGRRESSGGTTGSSLSRESTIFRLLVACGGHSATIRTEQFGLLFRWPGQKAARRFAVFLGDPAPTPADVKFPLFGIPVRIHPYFWVMAVFLGLHEPNVRTLLVWVAAVFVAVLVHELGHALTMRAYGYRPQIILYAFGGIATYGTYHSLDSAGQSHEAHVQIAAAGPLAGFLLAAVIAVLLTVAGPGVHVEWIGGFLPFVVPNGMIGSPLLSLFVLDLLVVCIFWGMINLLPVFPLDGGQIARHLLMRFLPAQGVRLSLMLSFVTGLAVAVLAFLLLHDMFIGLLFGLLAYNSFALLQTNFGRGPW